MPTNYVNIDKIIHNTISEGRVALKPDSDCIVCIIGKQLLYNVDNLGITGGSRARTQKMQLTHKFKKKIVK